MRLTGGPCAACRTLTGCTVLWPAEPAALRLWCCETCAARMGEDVRVALARAGRELAQRRARLTSQRTPSTPSA